MKDAQFGIGAYSPAEAARLIGTSPTNIRNWLFGYSYSHHGKEQSQQPLWSAQYGGNQEEPVLGFRDLIEARMVAKLRKLKIGLPTIRACMTAAAEIAQDPHPFSSAQFRTDGKSLFLERLNENGARDIIDLKSKQHAFPKIIENSFVDLEFDKEKATRWFPLHDSNLIVADPERSFGHPIVSNGGVPTSRLAQAFEAEGRSINRVAKLFEIGREAVKDALAFERQIGGLSPA